MRISCTRLNKSRRKKFCTDGEGEGGSVAVGRGWGYFCLIRIFIAIAMFGNLEGAVRRGRGGKEKEWTDCVQSDIRAFGITGDWETMAVKAEVWVEAVTKGGRRFMAAWRQEEEDAARHRQEKREATRLGKLQSHTEA